jgi:phosphoribosyl-ATP pyrophosphohydrolase
MAFTLYDLEALIAARAKETDGTSYTAKLLAGGLPLIARKFGEEALETVIAALASSSDKQALCNEAADTLYHLLVLLKAGNVPLDAVLSELERRKAQSGLSEKASRPAAS